MYIVLKKENNEILACTSKRAIAKFLEVSEVQIWRYISKCSKYEHSKYIIWSNIELTKGKQKGQFI